MINDIEFAIPIEEPRRFPYADYTIIGDITEIENVRLAPQGVSTFQRMI